MACFVTGIVPTENVSELESMLGSMPGIDRSKLSVITTAEPTREHADSFLNFIHAGAPEIESATMGRIGGDAIMTGSGGTGVPGLTNSGSSVNILFNDRVTQHIGSLPIPDDEVENYSEALEDNRCVIAYDCSGGDASAAEAAFHSAGARKVKTFT